MSRPAIPNDQRLIVALDLPSGNEARELVETLGDSVSFYKVGLELFTGADGFAVVDWLSAHDKQVFVDLKFFDVPATVARAVKQLRGRNITFATVHGNDAIMRAAAEVSGDVGILAVTVLTSLDSADMRDLGFDCDIPALVRSRARRALNLGCAGLLMYGIPMMKLDKHLVERRVELLRQAGVMFVTRTNIGTAVNVPDGHILNIMDETQAGMRHLPAEELLARHDALVLAVGAAEPRDLPIPGRTASGIYFAMEYLTRSTQSLYAKSQSPIDAAGKRVIVIGGGDTGADCIGTALRQGCQSIVNFELLDRPPSDRAPDNPWPQWPLIVRTDYAHSEAQHRFGKDPRNYSLLSKSFLVGDQGEVRAVQTVEVDWTRPGAKAPFTEVEGSEQEWPCDLVFLSMGFTGPERAVVDEFDLECDPRSNIHAGGPAYQSSRLPIFAAGDCRRGQSLVVWAIHEGREVAQAVDEYLRKRSQTSAVA